MIVNNTPNLVHVPRNSCTDPTNGPRTSKLEVPMEVIACSILNNDGLDLAVFASRF